MSTEKLLLCWNYSEKQLTNEGMRDIAQLASKMNRQKQRRYLESSETVCRTNQNQRFEDTVRPLQRCKEMRRNVHPPEEFWSF